MRESKRVGALVSVAALVGIVATSSSATAAPDDREACASSAESAQQLRDEGKYRRAREQMLSCARDACPGPIKSDCGKWLTELDRDAPTVVFGAKDSKGDLFDVKVSMDGVLVQERLDGKPVLVDSGEHTFKFEAKDGTTKEDKVLVRAAEKARPITMSFGSPAPAGGGDTKTAGGDTKTNGEGSSGSLVPAIVVGGIGVLALGSFAIFGISGKNAVDDLQDCKPNCKESDVDSARTKLIIADISLGVGIVALGVATYMFITRPKVDVKTAVTTAPPRDHVKLGFGASGLSGTF